MPRLSRALGLLGALSVSAALLAPSEADACGGGTFYETEVSDDETIATTGHNVVISISKEQTVLWDQITFSGAPKDFAWVYPIKAGARLELATDAWVESLAAGTAKVVVSTEEYCEDYDHSSADSGGGCGCMPGTAAGDANGAGDSRSFGEPPPVKVVHEATIGPYETKTISSATPGAIGTWLSDNGYGIPAAVQPTLDAYAAEGFDFIVLRLSPGQGVDHMKPVRVVTPGPITSFPMRMLAAGARGKVALNVIVLTEGRVAVDGFANGTLDASKLVWDFDAGGSNYGELRDAALAENGGATFLTTHAMRSTLLGALEGSAEGDSLGGLYLNQVGQNKEGGDCQPGEAASQDLRVIVSKAGNATVVDLCDEDGNCAEPKTGEVDSRLFACGTADDLAVALTGMHVGDVWVTRLEANLPKEALSKDLVLKPLSIEVQVPSVIQANTSTGDPCSDTLVTPAAPRSKPRLPPGAITALGAAVALALSAMRRLTGRRRAHA